ncbi:MAG: hypothetical protein ACYS8I_10080 [Planctomycetota bacterium]|jgi:DNA-directed RNA polymerase subunit RPC12/RpoP
MKAEKLRLLLAAVVTTALVIMCVLILMNEASRSRMQPAPILGSTWLKCRDPNCAAQYQIPLQQYHDFVEEYADPTVLGLPEMACKECGRKTVHRAFKCANCRIISFLGSIQADFEDRCPYCDHSQKQQNRKKAAEQRRQNTHPQPDANDQEPTFPLDKLAPISKQVHLPAMIELEYANSR